MSYSLIGENMGLLPGSVPTACYQRIPCEQGRSGKLPEGAGVGSDKPTKQGWPDGLSEVGLADSTRRQGEPVTGGSGQQDLNFSKET